MLLPCRRTPLWAAEGATIRTAGPPPGWSIDRLLFPTEGCIGLWWPWGLASQRWGATWKHSAVGRTGRSQGLTSQLHPTTSTLGQSINETKNHQESFRAVVLSIFGANCTIWNCDLPTVGRYAIDLSFMFIRCRRIVCAKVYSSNETTVILGQATDARRGVKPGGGMSAAKP